MSFWNVPDADYHELAVATPGWQNAPVPGWGINPLRAGPMRVGIGGGIPGEDDFLPHYAPLGADPETAYKETSWGVVAFAAAGGIALGLLFGYAQWSRKKLVANTGRKRRRKTAQGGAFAESGITALPVRFNPATGEEYRKPHVRMSSGVVYPDTKAGIRAAIERSEPWRVLMPSSGKPLTDAVLGTLLSEEANERATDVLGEDATVVFSKKDEEDFGFEVRCGEERMQIDGGYETLLFAFSAFMNWADRQEDDEDDED